MMDEYFLGVTMRPALREPDFDHTVDDTTPVTHYIQNASPFGVLDMAGNVLEWTVSLWGSNLGAPQFAYPSIQMMAEDHRPRTRSCVCCVVARSI